MKFLKFLISDKRGLKYFAFIIIPASIYGMLFIAGNTLETVLFGLTFILIPAFIYVGFYGSSYLNFLQQRRFSECYAEKIELEVTREVLLYQKGYTLSGPRTIYSAKIDRSPLKATYRFITLQGEKLLLCYVYDLDRFKRYLKPLHLSDTDDLHI